MLDARDCRGGLLREGGICRQEKLLKSGKYRVNYCRMFPALQFVVL